MRTLLLALVVAGTLGSGSASAQHRHHHTRASVGFVFSAPAYGPYYAPQPYPYYSYPPYYYYPPVIAVQPSPRVYIEREQDEPGGEYYWYYCGNPQGYYPYVRECKTNWQRVTPVPQGN